MAPDKFIQALVQQRHFQRAVQLKGERDVVGRAGGLEVIQEVQALLGKRQRLGFVRQRIRDDRRGLANRLRAEAVDQLRDGRCFEQCPHREIDLQGLAQPGDHLGGKYRVPTQLKEIIGNADVFQFEHLLPDVGNSLFHGRAGKHGLFALWRYAGRRQALAIDLSVGGQGQLFEDHEVVRDHVAGQGLRQVLAQLCRIGRVALADQQVSHDLLLAGLVFPDNHQPLANLGVVDQLRFDFAQFDAEPTDLDLMVDASEEFDLAARQPPGQVAGFIQAFSRRRSIGIGHELLCGQVGTVEVTTGDAFAADMQLARTARGAQVGTFIEDPKHGIGDRVANGTGVGRHTADGRPDGGFGRPIHVPERVGALQQLVRQRRCQGLATTEHLECQGAGPTGFKHQPIGRGCGLDEGDILVEGQLDQRLSIGCRFTLGQDQAGAVDQRQEKLEDADIERDGSHRQQAVLGADAGLRGHREQEVDDCPMRHLDTLRQTGGTRGVNHVGGVQGGDGIADGGGDSVGLSVIEQDNVQRFVAERFGVGAFAEQHLGAGILEHMQQPGMGVGGVHRHIGCAGHPGSEQRRNHADRAVEADRHAGLGTGAQRHQPRRDVPCLLLKLAVADLLPGAENRGGVRGQLYLGEEQVVHALIGVERGRQCRGGHQSRQPLFLGQ